MTAKDIALSELHTLQEIIKDVKDIELKALMKEINAAKRIFIGGAGRSLLSMKSFAMRLMQTGHETYLVGEVCTPSIQPGDLLIVGSRGLGADHRPREEIRRVGGSGPDARG